MLKIGEFSKIGQVSIKTLRYYDQVGLLKPAHIDRFNGYRYYTLSQLVRLNHIMALKDLDFTLDQIRELLNLDLSGEALEKMLHSKASDLRQHLSEEHARLLRVENRIKAIRGSGSMPQSPIVLKSSPNLLVATVREVLPGVGTLPEWQEAQCETIARTLDRLREKPTGPRLLIYHQDEYRETDLDVEVGTIIREARNNTEVRRMVGEIHIHTLFAVNHLATTIHSNEAGSLSDTYAKLAHWTQVNGFRPIGTWRELYYRSQPGGSQVIEIQRPVMNAIEFYQHLEANEMEPKIITKSPFTIVGLRYFGRNEHQEISELWGKFNEQVGESGPIENETGEAAIGLCITPEDAEEDGAFEYVAGFPVSAVGNVPEGFVVRHVPEYTYAVFAHQGDLPSLAKTYEYIYETWLPQSSYQLAAKLDFEYYNEDFKDFAPDSIFYIYVPIEKA